MFSLAVLCWQWAIFPARLQASIVASAELNFCVRNGNRWTLCERTPTFVRFSRTLFFWSAEILQDKAEGSKDGDGVVSYSELSASTDNAVLRNLCDQKCQRLAIFPARLQASIVASTELNFCVRNGNRWTLCEKTLTNLTIVKVKGMSYEKPKLKQP